MKIRALVESVTRRADSHVETAEVEVSSNMVRSLSDSRALAASVKLCDPADFSRFQPGDLVTVTIEPERRAQ